MNTKKGFCHAILALDDRRLTAEAKYLLIRVIYLYGDALVTAKVKELAKKVGLSDEVFAKARTLLSSLGLVEVTPVLDSSTDKEKSGRPRLAFKISPKFMNDMRSREGEMSRVNSQDNHPQLLNRLLFWSSEGDSLRARNIKKTKRTGSDTTTRHTFTVATRILLAILYLHADPCGVVSDLGLSRLSRLTGMSKDRLESQLEIIKNLGYLIDRVSGLTGKRLYGRAIGSFYMNVCDEDSETFGSFKLIALETNVINFYNEHFWGFRLYNESWLNAGYVFDREVFISTPNALAYYLANWFDDAYLSIDSPGVDWSERLADLLDATRRMLEAKGLYGKKCAWFIDGSTTSLFVGAVGQWVFNWSHYFLAFNLQEFFADRPIWGFSRYLQARIDQYTALILNLGLRKIEIETLVVFDAVLERIGSDHFPKSLDDNNQEGARRSAFALLLYCISYQQALLIKSLIMKAEIAPGLLSDDQFGFSFAILPVRLPIHKWANRMTVAIRGGKNGHSERFCAVKFDGGNVKHPKIEKFSHEHDPVKCREIFSEFGYDIVALQGMTK